MESEETARQWLTSAQSGLGGAVPLKYAETEDGNFLKKSVQRIHVRSVLFLPFSFVL
jgi:hypothetical protein